MRERKENEVLPLKLLSCAMQVGVVDLGSAKPHSFLEIWQIPSLYPLPC